MRAGRAWRTRAGLGGGKARGAETHSGGPPGERGTRGARGRTARGQTARRAGGGEARGARGEQSQTRSNFVMDAYARFRYTVKADVPEWRNGRRGGLKNRCLTTCEFDSRLGHQFSRFCKAALWVAFFHSLSKTGPEGIGFVIQMEGTRETVLRVRKLQRLLMPAARKDEAARWHPPNCQP